MNEIVQYYDNKCKEIEKRTKDLQKDKYDLFLNFCKECLKLPKVKRISGLGYTPGFNDGEPCYHRQDVGLNYNDYNVDDMDFHQYEKECVNEYGVWNRVLGELSWCLEDEWGTDWEIGIVLDENGELKIEKEDYYCGY